MEKAGSSSSGTSVMESASKISEYMPSARRRTFVVMLAGIGIMGIGVALFKLSLMGNDPHTALMIAIGNRLGVDFSIVLFLVNCLWFFAEWSSGRELIGIGTFINWLFVGPLASLCEKAVRSVCGVSLETDARIWLMVAGVVTLSLACALYQTADMGVAPYDALSIILSRKSRRPYLRCRMLTDSLCALIAFMLGGLIGVGTLVCALGLGPFITFFSEKVARRFIPASEKT
ncbi:hypothetical protein AALB64_07070 [Lachnospiraceae bacterium 45-P1]